ncbi:small ribosomal subunit protein bS20c-like [Phragmites australis]|uniref:small ribosomal subunit protein bS20c-like n=1 Tax=Phragmites australis TaxID=29695 RepID=UPI002D781B2F|nr:small ribosomal subunit protein bS20c-like [Phragmites australis]
MATTATSPLFSLSSLSASLPSPTRPPSSLPIRSLSPRACLSASLPFASPLGGFGNWASTSSAGRWRKRGLEVVCEATTGRRPDSVKKRERQNDRHRIRNHARKAEMRTRMKKVFRALEKLRKKADAQPEEIIEIEKMISEAYKAIDKTVKVGAMHRNTGNHRKSRLARRKKAIEILRGWYVPNAEPAAAA